MLQGRLVDMGNKADVTEDEVLAMIIAARGRSRSRSRTSPSSHGH